MKNKLIALAETGDKYFWLEFMRLMVGDDGFPIFDKLRIIYASGNNIAEAKKKLRALADEVK